MAIPAKLLEDLLALDERERLEIVLVLLDSIDDDHLAGDHERAKLHASIDRALAECARRETVPLADALASLRAKRAARAAHPK